MGKIGLIIKREYLTRVRNRTFIIMTILGPLLMIGFYGLLIYALISQEDKPHTVCVVSESKFPFYDMEAPFKKYNVMRPNSNLKFVFKYKDKFEAVDHLEDEEYQSVLYIPPNCPPHYSGMRLWYKERPSNSIKLAIDQEVSKMAEDINMINFGVDPLYKDSIHAYVTVPMDDAKNMDGLAERNLEDLRTAQMGIAYILGVLIYFFIFMYGVQVFRGVMEEKTSRIVEVVVSSVKPYQLMLGKILGIALVGLTQFLILIVVTGGVIVGLTAAFAPTLIEQVNSGTMDAQMNMSGVNFGAFINLPPRYIISLIVIFLFYFIFGYLLYASFFAAVGSAVDSESDSQQFMLPITMPVIFSFVMSFYVINDPDGPLGTFLSIFPLTSPIIMTVRIAVGNFNIWQLVLSMLLLVTTFYFVVRMAAKIYRTGILMYGKKPTYKELWKWLRYKN